MNNHWPIITREKNIEVDDSIRFWKDFYDADRFGGGAYFANLKPANELTTENIRQLFLWKNGTPFSGKKAQSVERVGVYLPRILSKFGSSEYSMEDLEKIFYFARRNIFRTGYIWNLFLIHVLQYDNCPIADRYVYKAYRYICGANVCNDWNTYVHYRQFFNDMAQRTGRIEMKQRKEIDEALWGFGKYLSSPYARIANGE